ncbi:MAG: zinc ribbon domain-containing protein [Acidobacteria bacterium]|nr:zinc ribbon domain-containing protein [Acidobacteriota bacterium]
MNSEISTRPPLAHNADPADAGAGFRPWHFFVLASLMAATVAVLMAPSPTPEHLILISVTLAAAGLVGAAFHRTLLPLVSSNAELTSEPLGRRSRAALEREKTLVLRSIKELEFDRAMGKVADEDFNDMVTRLRARAIAIMKLLDQGTSYREMIEKDLERLKKRSGASFEPPAGATKAPDPFFCACGATNDPDARFCKKCGVRLAGVA